MARLMTMRAALLRAKPLVHMQQQQWRGVVSSIKPRVASYDLVVIGSGPSATQCAIESAKKGKRVAVVDKKTFVGGVCVHTGTIPSKTFREAVLHLSGYRHHGYVHFGLDANVTVLLQAWTACSFSSTNRMLITVGSTASRTR